MKNLALILVLICASQKIFAQHEVGISLGTSHLLGDFGGGPGTGSLFIKDIDLKSTRPSVGLFYRYNFAKFLSARAQFIYGQLHSNDLFSEESFRKSRALISKSNVFDGSLQLEFNFIPLKFCSSKARFSPYVAVGIGLAGVNAAVSSSNIEGIPNTENQYIQSGSALAVNIPMTAGVKYKMKQNVVFGLETSYRMAFTDKLDNYVRQENDHFFFVSATVSYVFCTGKKQNSKCATYD